MRKIRLTHILYHHPTFFDSEGLEGFMIHISIKISQKIGLLRASKVLYYITSSDHYTPGLSGFWDQSQANSALYSAFWSVEATDFENAI